MTVGNLIVFALNVALALWLTSCAPLPGADHTAAPTSPVKAMHQQVGAVRAR